jgi:ArsR family transcriptional regulator, virulence genes transcriptional regulator
MLSERLENTQIEYAAEMLKVIAHPIRLSMIDLLTTSKRLTISEIQDALNLEQAVVSQHVTLMENRGVLTSKKEGRSKYVSLKHPKMKAIISCIENCCKD